MPYHRVLFGICNSDVKIVISYNCGNLVHKFRNHLSWTDWLFWWLSPADSELYNYHHKQWSYDVFCERHHVRIKPGGKHVGDRTLLKMGPRQASWNWHCEAKTQTFRCALGSKRIKPSFLDGLIRCDYNVKWQWSTQRFHASASLQSSFGKGAAMKGCVGHDVISQLHFKHAPRWKFRM